MGGQNQQGLDKRDRQHAYHDYRQDPEEFAHDSSGVSKRNEGDLGSQDGQGHGHCHLFDALYCGGGPFHSLLSIGEYVLTDDDGIIDDDAERHDECKEAYHVYGDVEVRYDVECSEE